MYNFHDILLPDFITIHLKGGPVFVTNHANTSSGREMRILEREASFQKYHLNDCRLSEEQFNIFNCFFRNRRGSYYSFRIKDHADYKLENRGTLIYREALGVFEIYKIYKDDASSYLRRITNLREATVKCNSEVAKIDYKTGVIYTNHNDLSITEGEFDVAVRFVNDEFKYSFLQDGSILIDKLELQEVGI